MPDFNKPDSFDRQEHVQENWGFQPGKAVYVMEGVPGAAFRSNPTVAYTYTSLTSYGRRVAYTETYVLSGATVTRWRRNYSYTGGDLTSESAWMLV